MTEKISPEVNGWGQMVHDLRYGMKSILEQKIAELQIDGQSLRMVAEATDF